MDTYQQALPQPTYQPAIVPTPGTRKHSLRKIAIATIESPARVCGVARRIGYTGVLETDLAMYRLRVKSDDGPVAITLAGFFVLENGVFRAYESGQTSSLRETPG
ncbi:MAG TPA: hypothetical protein VFV38_26225 [Ktedonobacteraceae bacterium]|nr:hypothetical protein [Ktedonobacteraceae bacterium]